MASLKTRIEVAALAAFGAIVAAALYMQSIALPAHFA